MKIDKESAEKLKEILTKEGAIGLRVAVKGGGCSGFMYELHLINKQEEDDLVFDDKGVKLFIDPISIAYLAESTLSFDNDPLNASFVIKNPAVTRSCGCGSSFTVD